MGRMVVRFKLKDVPLISCVFEQKFYKEQYNREKGKWSCTNLKSLPEVEHALVVSQNQSQVQTPD